MKYDQQLEWVNKKELIMIAKKVGVKIGKKPIAKLIEEVAFKMKGGVVK